MIHTEIPPPLHAQLRRRNQVGRMLAVGLAVFALVATSLAPTSAQATYADAGDGQHKGAIDWLEWGADGTQILNGSVSSSTRMLNNQPLTITCTASGVEGEAEAYRSGRWKGDALPLLYSKGDAKDNTLVAGIANTVDGTTVRFHLECDANYGGEAVPINGLVISDAESNNADQGEYVSARPSEEATWRLLDRIRAEGCTTATRANLAPEGTLTLNSDGPECTYQSGSWRGPVATAFMEGATGASFELKGGGRSAIAVGVVVASDFGDAPESYGDAGAFIHQEWVGGVIPVGVSNLFEDIELAKATVGNVGLGELIDTEDAPQYSADALGDDENGISDEDLALPERIDATPGETFTLSSIVCGTEAHVAAWIDWNRDGFFSDAERSDTASCISGEATLTWQVPSEAGANMLAGPSFARFRSSSDPTQLTSPVGMTSDGEVEDHAVQLFAPAPALELSKSSVPQVETTVEYNETVKYTVVAENTGNLPLDPVTVTDDLSKVLAHATYNGDAAATRGSAPTLKGKTLNWVGQLDPGESVTLTYSFTINEVYETGTLVNVVQATGKPSIGELITTPEVSTVHQLRESRAILSVPDPDPEPVPDPEPTKEPVPDPKPAPDPEQPVPDPEQPPETPPTDPHAFLTKITLHATPTIFDEEIPPTIQVKKPAEVPVAGPAKPGAILAATGAQLPTLALATMGLLGAALVLMGIHPRGIRSRGHGVK